MTVKRNIKDIPFTKKTNDIYPNNYEIKLEGETFLNIDVTEDESLVEVQFTETN